MRKVLVSVILVILSLTVPQLASAQTIGYAEAVRELTAACGADIEKHCGDVRPGGGAIKACLAKNANQISGKCTQTFENVFALLEKRAAAQAAVPEICRADAQRLCSNFRQGNARILRCLTRSDNVRKVTNKCNQAITDAGWR